MKRIRVIGVGPGDPDQVTVEAIRAIREVDYFIVNDRSGRGGMPDPLVHARERLLDQHLGHEPVIVRISGPDEGVAAYEAALLAHDGVAGFLVWGDPAFYDSALRTIREVGEQGEVDLEVDVVPGISSIQLLAARHRLVLQEVGQPLHITSGRLLHEAIAQGQDNVVVMLNRVIALDDLPVDVGDWSIWWGGNLGTATEELVAGRVSEVLPEIEAARARLTSGAGWVMDIYVLRAPTSGDL
ncbi:precorrin 6A synthase [Nocardioides sp. CN2-186]|uniref:precorrin 6A synthase n=1 Tax=Nocardioides tweenelious TaxID=3156607 RepID=UPI0032B3D450